MANGTETHRAGIRIEGGAGVPFSGHGGSGSGVSREAGASAHLLYGEPRGSCAGGRSDRRVAPGRGASLKFDPPLREARLVQRYKRFLADAELADGRVVTMHCPNTGAMLGCAEPGSRIWYWDSGNPRRKYALTWELIEVQDGSLVGINTLRANRLVEEALRSGNLPGFRDYQDVRSEVAVRHSVKSGRIDFRLRAPGRSDCYLEVKSVTMVVESGARFISRRAQRAGSTSSCDSLRSCAEGLSCSAVVLRPAYGDSSHIVGRENRSRIRRGVAPRGRIGGRSSGLRCADKSRAYRDRQRITGCH